MAFHSCMDVGEGTMTVVGVYHDHKPMTAIIRIKTSEGLILAADGRSLDEDGKICETNQKIFEIKSPFGLLAVGISNSGQAQFVDHERMLLCIEYGKELQRLANNIKLPQSLNMFQFETDIVKSFVHYVQNKIRQASIDGVIPKEDYQSWLNCNRETQFQFLGYEGKEPFLTTIRVISTHENIQILPINHITFSSSTSSTGMFFGSDIVLSHIQNQIDKSMDKYRTDGMMKVFRGESTTLQEGIEAAKSYIDACSTQQACKWDSYCKSIGGKLHIATIKPDKGFEWVSGYEPVAS